MRTTGMIRRIDELGRVVIPKEIRRTMRLKVGEELEIFVDPENGLVFKKYSALDRLNEVALPYVDALTEAVKCTALVADRDKIVAASGDHKHDFQDKNISARVERLMNGRTTLTLSKENCINICGEEYMPAVEMFAPIVVGGDVIGCIILVSELANLEDKEMVLAEIAASIFRRLN